ncbi:hypothetical protein BUALT_Bualt09G0066800 [Buddleja alternifolia]|uniref:DUF7086 domain-containing protein n=1 Tax=Buddleja alternifolia TaxID=168488 RepID=A0AAV6X0I7_9LAMI|nr:hypothetical protein BUALT_Bualt09G0066800 [Buddleja alternifolia]
MLYPSSPNNQQFLDLSLSTPSDDPPPTHAPPQQDTQTTAPSRRRRSVNQILRPGKSLTIPPPYPWSTTRRATVHSLQYLQAKSINTITGRVQCKKCDRKFSIEYDLHDKFAEVAIFIAKNDDEMHHRAPEAWMNPSLPNCKFCDQSNCAKPIMSKKRSINWLFLFLGQMIGVCKLSELKYFCKHTKNHRTGAKNRVLYLTYMGLCRQLNPAPL